MSTKQLFEETEMTALVEQPEVASPTPMALIQTALAQNIDADKLEKLLDLQERWDKARAKEAYAAAMNKCQLEMPVVVRDRMNTQTNAKYATFEALQERIKPVYLKHGFSLSRGTADSPLPAHYRCVCDVSHTGGHSERYFLDLPADGCGIKGTVNKTPVQAIGSTLSYGDRYLVARIFNITIAGEDNDGNDGGKLVAMEQEVTIIELIDQFPNPADEKAKFLRWFGIEKVSDLAASRFGDATSKLRGRLNANR